MASEANQVPKICPRRRVSCEPSQSVDMPVGERQAEASQIDAGPEDYDDSFLYQVRRRTVTLSHMMFTGVSCRTVAGV